MSGKNEKSKDTRGNLFIAAGMLAGSAMLIGAGVQIERSNDTASTTPPRQEVTFDQSNAYQGNLLPAAGMVHTKTEQTQPAAGEIVVSAVSVPVGEAHMPVTEVPTASQSPDNPPR